MRNIIKELFAKKKLVEAEEKCKDKIEISDIFLSRPFLKESIGKVPDEEGLLNSKGLEIIMTRNGGFTQAYQLTIDMSSVEKTIVNLYKIGVSDHYGSPLLQKECLVKDMICQKLWNTVPLRECLNRVLWDLAVYQNIIFVGDSNKIVDQMFVQNLVDHNYAALIPIRDVENTFIPGTTRHTVVFREHYASTSYIVSYDIEGKKPYLNVSVVDDYKKSLLFEGTAVEIANLAAQCKMHNNKETLFIDVLNAICVSHGFKFLSNSSTTLAEKLRAFNLYRDMHWITITPYECTENVVKREIQYFSYFPIEIIELKKNNDDEYKSFINDAVNIVATSSEFGELCKYYAQFGATLKSATSIIDDNLEIILTFRHIRTPMGMYDFVSLVFKFIYKYPMKCVEFKNS